MSRIRNSLCRSRAYWISILHSTPMKHQIKNKFKQKEQAPVNSNDYELAQKLVQFCYSKSSRETQILLIPFILLQYILKLLNINSKRKACTHFHRGSGWAWLSEHGPMTYQHCGHLKDTAVTSSSHPFSGYHWIKCVVRINVVLFLVKNLVELLNRLVASAFSCS